MRMYSLFARILPVVVLLFAACVEPDDGSSPAQSTPIDSSSASHPAFEYILIANEGQFNRSNASVGRYHPGTGRYEENLFKTANGSSPGDILQTAELAFGKLFLAMNNSSKVLVVDTADWQVETPVEGLPTPNGVCPVQSGKLYITDLYEHKLRIADWRSGASLGQIDLRSPSGALARVGDYLFVALIPVDFGRPVEASETNAVAVIDLATDELVARVPVGVYPNSMEVDAQNRLWVACQGPIQNDSTTGGLYRLATEPPFEVQAEWSARQGGLEFLEIDTAEGRLYWLNGAAVYQMGTEESALPSQPILESEAATAYSFALMPNGDFLIGDALDFVQSGTVYRYDPQGELIQKFQAGVIPKRFIAY